MDRDLRSGVLPYVLLSPAVLATVIVVFYPMAQAIVTSLYQSILWKPRDVHFIGLDNYSALLHDPVFWSSLGRTAIWIGLTVPLQMLLGLVTALFLNQEFRWRGLARSLILIPWALPSVVIGLMWAWIYNPQVGLLNDLLLRLGLLQSAMPWLANPATSLYAIIAGAGVARLSVLRDHDPGRPADHSCRRCTRPRKSTVPARGISSGISRCPGFVACWSRR